MEDLDLSHWLRKTGANEGLCARICHFYDELLTGEYKDDVWDVINWENRIENKKKLILDFRNITNSSLKNLAKVWILDERKKKGIKGSSAKTKLYVVRALNYNYFLEDIDKIKTLDFYNTERWFFENYAKTTAANFARNLKTLGRWLSANFDLSIDYQLKTTPRISHGRTGTEEGRQDKLLPIEVLSELVGSLHDQNINEKDRFFLSLIAANIGIGCRISEMSLLPYDCLIKEGNVLQVRLFSGKGGTPLARPVDPIISEVVEDAINWLKSRTIDGRKIAHDYRKQPKLVWRNITQNSIAFRYFFKKWAHLWTKNSNNLIINPNGAWYEKWRKFIDAVGFLEDAEGNKTEASKEVGVYRVTLERLLEKQRNSINGKLPPIPNTNGLKRSVNSWIKDPRVISIKTFERDVGLQLGKNSKELIKDVINEALAYQMAGEIYPKPVEESVLENEYKEKLNPILVDGKSKPHLFPDEALLVTPKYKFSSFATKFDEFQLVSSKNIRDWLAGSDRNGAETNNDLPACKRLGVIDPRTGDYASFTWHDIRHWLDTMYEEGGFSEEQLGIIFNRKSYRQNSTYDQVSKKGRVERLREGLRNNIMVGVVQDTYNILVSEESREEAEAYLEAATRCCLSRKTAGHRLFYP